MKRPINPTLKELLIGIASYGVLLMGIGPLLVSQKWLYARGALLGLLLAAGMAWHMERSLDKALDLGESGAQNYIRKTYTLRVVVLMFAMGIAVYVKFAEVIPIFLGTMGLKAAAYLQPLIHSFLDKRKQKLAK